MQIAFPHATTTKMIRRKVAIERRVESAKLFLRLFQKKKHKKK